MNLEQERHRNIESSLRFYLFILQGQNSSCELFSVFTYASYLVFFIDSLLGGVSSNPIAAIGINK